MTPATAWKTEHRSQAVFSPSKDVTIPRLGCPVDLVTRSASPPIPCNGDELVRKQDSPSYLFLQQFKGGFRFWLLISTAFGGGAVLHEQLVERFEAEGSYQLLPVCHLRTKHVWRDPKSFGYLKTTITKEFLGVLEEIYGEPEEEGKQVFSLFLPRRIGCSYRRCGAVLQLWIPL